LTPLPGHLETVTDAAAHALRMANGGLLSVTAANQLSEQVVKALHEADYFKEPVKCEQITSVGSTNPEAPNFGEDETCENDALLGLRFCNSHI